MTVTLPRGMTHPIIRPDTAARCWLRVKADRSRRALLAANTRRYGSQAAAAAQYAATTRDRVAAAFGTVGPARRTPTV